MKILYLRLTNSAGIWAGMSKEDIEIDFNKSENNIIMLFGANGSGKSTILSSLNPFPSSTNDERKAFFKKGVEGFKEIHYLKDDNVFMIRHYIKKQTKSFISQISYKKYTKLLKEISLKEIYDNGKELNENGGVKTFNEIVQSELGVDEEYFKISRIGSNVTNFIDLSVADRKKYIGNFLPNIDEYLAKYKIVNEKTKLLNKEIKFVSDEILKLDEEENIRTELEKNTELLKGYKEAVEKLDKKINKAKGQISVLDEGEVLKNNDYENLYEEEFEEIKKRFEEINDLLSETEEKSVEEISSDITNLEKKLISINSDYKNNKSNLESLNEQKDEVYDKKNDLEEQLNDIDLDDLAELNKYAKERKDEIKELDKSSKELFDILKKDGFDLEHIEQKDVDISSVTLKGIKKLVSIHIANLEEEYKDLLKEVFTKKDGYEKIIDNIDDYKEELSQANTNKQNTESELISLKSHLESKKILEQRPSKCKIDDCPFIEDALKYKNIDSDIKEKETMLKKIKENIKLIQKSIDDCEYVIKISNLFNLDEDTCKKLSKISSKFKEIFKDGFKSLIKFIITNDITTITKQLSLDDVREYLHILEERQSANSDLELTNSKIEKMNLLQSTKEKNEKELEKVNNKMKKIENDIENIKKVLKELTEKKESIDETLNEKKKIKESLVEFDTVKKDYESIEKKYNEADETLEKINEIAEKVSDWKQERKENNKFIPSLEETINGLNLKLEKLKEYHKRKNNLDEKFEKYNLVKDALNPVKGIPVYFISDYLNKTEKITNNLLDISQNGKFAIKFFVDDKNFFIQVFKDNGDELEDINLASQGEISLTTLSLSLALMEQSMSIYNIFYLDELDGALDDHNRKAFIEMVENQMISLGSDQVFIISHNKEFDYYPLDMILLDGNSIDTANKEFMSNKNIIFSVA